MLGSIALHVHLASAAVIETLQSYIMSIIHLHGVRTGPPVLFSYGPKFAQSPPGLRTMDGVVFFARTEPTNSEKVSNIWTREGVRSPTRETTATKVLV